CPLTLVREGRESNLDRVDVRVRDRHPRAPPVATAVRAEPGAAPARLGRTRRGLPRSGGVLEGEAGPAHQGGRGHHADHAPPEPGWARRRTNFRISQRWGAAW